MLWMAEDVMSKQTTQGDTSWQSKRMCLRLWKSEYQDLEGKHDTSSVPIWPMPQVVYCGVL